MQYREYLGHAAHISFEDPLLPLTYDQGRAEKVAGWRIGTLSLQAD